MKDSDKDMFIIPQNISSSEVKAVFTTRQENNEITDIAGEFRVEEDKIYRPVQQHTDTIYILDKDLNPVVADAVLTVQKGIAIGVQTADCVPVLLYEKDKAVIGVVHAGWRGTAAGILINTIIKMKDIFRLSGNTIMIAFGPSIRQCCYNVGYDVMSAVSRATGKGDYCMERDGKFFIDLASANVKQALSAGISENNIWLSDECTFCNPDRFYSYRFESRTTGRQGGFIMLK